MSEDLGITHRQASVEMPADELADALAVDASPERHAALLGDPRLAHRSNAAQRARAMTQLQRSHGNASVQRMLQRAKVQKQESGVVQRVILDIAALGLAAFAEGRSLATSGSLAHSANTPSYMHETTPPSETWETMTTELHVVAWHPRAGWGLQDFWFRLSYERNGYDIRNATINLLESRCSSMIMSHFSINWSGQSHSLPSDPVAQIIFNISGRWDPTGRGVAGFWGRLIISASKDADMYQEWNLESEPQSWSQRPVRTASIH